VTYLVEKKRDSKEIGTRLKTRAFRATPPKIEGVSRHGVGREYERKKASPYTLHLGERLDD